MGKLSWVEQHKKKTVFEVLVPISDTIICAFLYEQSALSHNSIMMKAPILAKSILCPRHSKTQDTGILN